MPRSRVVIAGHSLHPILVVFPLGLFATSLVWDICFLITKQPMWAQISFWTIVAGIVGGLCAAVPGFIDWLGIPDRTRAKRIGITHLALNVLVIVLFVISATWRRAIGYSEALLGAMVVGWLGLAVAVVSGWLGGELVERLGVSIWPDANLDAPSSLRGGRPQRVAPAPRAPTSPVGPREPTPHAP